MITQTYTYASFYYSDENYGKIQKTYTNALHDFTETQVDVNLETFLTNLKSNQNLIDEAKVESIAIFHTLFYKNQCNTEFSPKVIELMNSLNATFCITTQILTEKDDLYDILDKMRERPAMYLGNVSITRLEAFINGFLFAQNGETQEKPSFDEFNDFVDAYYNNFNVAGWRNKILADHYGNEDEAITQFYKLLDEFRLNEKKPNSKHIVHRLLHLSLLDFRAENDHERQKQIADLLHHVPNQLKISSKYLFDYDAILEDIFLRSQSNDYLHHWIKRNVPETAFYEYEIYHGSSTYTSTMAVKSNHENKTTLIEYHEKLVQKFYAINQDKANEIVEKWKLNSYKQYEKDKIMQQYDLAFLTEYYQFYILDSQSAGKTDAPDFWCDIAGERRLAIGEGIFGVTIATYGQVSGELRILDKQPMEDLEADHIIEASLKFPSGKLEIRDCTGYETQLAINLDKDDYRIRISSFDLDSVKTEIDNDKYIVEIWKSEFEAPKLIKKYVE